MDLKIKKLINILSRGIEITARPFSDIAAKVEMTEDAVVEEVNKLIREKKIRRFAAVIRQGKVGYGANAMCAFNVEDRFVTAAGEEAAKLSEVSHCYERARAGSWNYNIYAMVHAKDAAECRAIAKKIADLAHTSDYRVIFSSRELKKQNAVYFDGVNEIEAVKK